MSEDRVQKPERTSIVGIPGTVSGSAKKIRWHRHQDHIGCRVYESDVADGKIVALVSLECHPKANRPLWHLSLSHQDLDGKPGRYPDWDEMKHAFYSLVPADVPMILVFPRKSVAKEGGYVNIMETCLHLWEPNEEGIDQ